MSTQSIHQTAAESLRGAQAKRLSSALLSIVDEADVNYPDMFDVALSACLQEFKATEDRDMEFVDFVEAVVGGLKPQPKPPFYRNDATWQVDYSQPQGSHRHVAHKTHAGTKIGQRTYRSWCRVYAEDDRSASPRVLNIGPADPSLVTCAGCRRALDAA